MLPSRGLRAVQLGAHVPFRASRRFVSSYYQSPTNVTQSILPSRRQTAFRNGTPYSAPNLRNNALKAFSITSIATPRYYTSNNNNTDIANQLPGATQPPPFIPDSARLDEVYLDSALPELKPDLSILADPSKIGYLNSIGLDHGWGPSSMFQWTLEHCHIWGGLPWWGSIVASAIAFRVVLFPLYVKLAEFQGRQAALKPVIEPIQQRRKEAMARGDDQAGQAALKEMQQVYRESGTMKGLKYMAAPVLQMVFGFCAWRVLRQAAALPVPGFINGGMLWLTDLTLPDPIYALPMITSIMMHLMMRRSTSLGTNPMLDSPIARNIFLYVLPAMSFIFTCWQSAALQLYFALGTAMSTLQSFLFQENWFRRLVGISPIPKDSEKMAGISISKPKDTTVTRKATDYRWEAPRGKTPAPQEKLSPLKPSTWKASLQKAAGQNIDTDSPSALKKAHRERAQKYEERRKKEIARQKRLEQEGFGK